MENTIEELKSHSQMLGMICNEVADFGEAEDLPEETSTYEMVRYLRLKYNLLLAEKELHEFQSKIMIDNS